MMYLFMFHLIDAYLFFGLNPTCACQKGNISSHLILESSEANF